MLTDVTTTGSVCGKPVDIWECTKHAYVGGQVVPGARMEGVRACFGFGADLAMIGGLPTLLRLLESAQPGIRARAAEVLATCSQANPPVQVAPAPVLHCRPQCKYSCY